MIVGSVQGWGGGGQLWSVVEVECGRGLAMSHILGKMSYSHKYLNVLNLLNVFTLGPDLKTSLYAVWCPKTNLKSQISGKKAII